MPATYVLWLISLSFYFYYVHWNVTTVNIKNTVHLTGVFTDNGKCT